MSKINLATKAKELIDNKTDIVELLSNAYEVGFYEEESNAILGRRYKNYLVISYANWRGACGFKVCKRDEVFYCNYERTLTMTYKPKGGKCIAFTEYSHDCPCGASVYLIGLTVNEYNNLTYGYGEVDWYMCNKIFTKYQTLLKLDSSIKTTK